MTYNVLMGLEHADRKKTFIDFMIELAVDVLALQELNGIWPKEVKSLASSYGHIAIVLSVQVSRELKF